MNQEDDAGQVGWWCLRGLIGRRAERLTTVHLVRRAVTTTVDKEKSGA
jgi:hypothetical protein